MKALYTIAWICLVLSVIVHIISIFGPEDVLSGIDAFVWILHGGAILLGFPLVLCLQKITIGTKEKDFWRAALTYCPSWMKKMVGFFVFYGIINFIYFISTGTESNGDETPASVFRGFSGHWMIFYSLEVAIFCSYLRKCSVSLNRSSKHDLTTNEDICQQGYINSQFPKEKPKQYTRYIVAFLVVGSVFLTLLWLAFKGYPWYLGVFMFSLFPFACIHVAYMFFYTLRFTIYLKKNHSHIWQLGNSSWFEDRKESQRLILELDDPHIKSMNLQGKKFYTICFWFWLVLIVIALVVLAGIQYFYI